MKQFLISVVALTGALTSQAEEVSIQMVTNGSCPVCDRWEAEARPILEKVQGVVVKPNRFREEGEAIRVFPTFIVEHKGRKARIEGYRGWMWHRDQLRKALEALGVDPLVCCFRTRPVPVFRTPIRTYWMRPRGFLTAQVE